MFNFIVGVIAIFVILKVLVTKFSSKLLQINPYIQTFIAFPISFTIVVKVQNSFLIGLCMYMITVYLGLLFQEYYQKFSFKGDSC